MYTKLLLALAMSFSVNLALAEHESYPKVGGKDVCSWWSEARAQVAWDRENGVDAETSYYKFYEKVAKEWPDAEPLIAMHMQHVWTMGLSRDDQYDWTYKDCLRDYGH